MSPASKGGRHRGESLGDGRRWFAVDEKRRPSGLEGEVDQRQRDRADDDRGHEIGQGRRLFARRARKLAAAKQAGPLLRHGFSSSRSFGPIGADTDATQTFWAKALGIPLEEDEPGYFQTFDLDDTKAFALWPLTQAAQATFGTSGWPADRPVPQA
jgi:hypothetical protein